MIDEKKFDELIDSFLLHSVGISKHFLSLDICNALKENIEALELHKEMKPAGMGNEVLVLKDKLYRNDKIFWIDKTHNNKAENAFLAIMDLFVLYLNSTCYAGITSYEFHYTIYEKGSFYLKHIDQFKNNQSRKYSMIFYLNEDWSAPDGGELCIHHADYLQRISPTNGKGVFFESHEMIHEVLVCNKTRMSITGWLKVN